MAAKTRQARQTRTISLLNMKGGVGKTTLAVNLAWHLCRRLHKRVLLVDLDPQFNASQYLMLPDEWTKHVRKKGSVANLLLDPARPGMQLPKGKAAKAPKTSDYVFAKESTDEGGVLDLIPSELELARAIKNPDRVAYRLERGLESIRAGYDYVLIDCAPTDSILTDTALMASDYVLVPMRPDRFSVLGFAHIQRTISSFQDAYPDPHQVRDLGVVFTQVVGDSEIEDSCMAEIGRQTAHVFATTIGQSTSFLRAVHEQTPVFDTRYARQLTRATISDLFDEVQTRIAKLDKSKLEGK